MDDLGTVIHHLMSQGVLGVDYQSCPAAVWQKTTVARESCLDHPSICSSTCALVLGACRLARSALPENRTQDACRQHRKAFLPGPGLARFEGRSKSYWHIDCSRAAGAATLQQIWRTHNTRYTTVNTRSCKRARTLLAGSLRAWQLCASSGQLARF